MLTTEKSYHNHYHCCHHHHYHHHHQYHLSPSSLPPSPSSSSFVTIIIVVTAIVAIIIISQHLCMGSVSGGQGFCNINWLELDFKLFAFLILIIDGTRFPWPPYPSHYQVFKRIVFACFICLCCSLSMNAISTVYQLFIIYVYVYIFITSFLH